MKLNCIICIQVFNKTKEYNPQSATISSYYEIYNCLWLVLWISWRCPVGLHGQAYLTSGLWRGRNQWYFMKHKRRNESKREGEEKGRGGITDKWMWNKCSTDLFSSIFYSQRAAILQSLSYLKLEECACCLCVHKKVKMCIFDPDLCVYCVSVCMMPLIVCIKWLRAPEYSRGIYTLNHTVQRCNTKGNTKGGGKRSRNTSHMQCSLKICSLAHWGNYGSQLAK